jgi:CBS-domain-containing membrane protein
MRFTVKDVMTTHVITVRKSASFKEMAEKLREHRVSAFPVVDDDGKVIGVISEADLLTKEALDGGHAAMPGMISGMLQRREQERAAGLTAADLMTCPAVTVGPDDPVEHAARLMYVRRVKRLPVTDTAGRLVGIISRADVLAVYSRPDEEIRKEITGEVILGEFLTAPARFTVTVRDGIVTLEGRPETVPLGRDIISQVWHVQGVIAVRDRLSYPPSERPVHPSPLS